MSRPRPTLRSLAAAFLLLPACSSGTGPDSDLEAAHIRWSRTHPTDYSFEFAMATAWFPPSGYYWVDVRDGNVIAARHVATGDPVLVQNAFTIDDLWERLIAARNRGESLTELRFSREGVPLEAMIGTFADDGGVHYAVRNFVRRR
jgi:uncharacterized protein DUF6174